VLDHTTNARFRKDFEEELSELFTEVLWLCGRGGLVKVGTVVVDRRKMAGNASLERLKGEVGRMLREAEEVETQEDARCREGVRGDELSEELARRKESTG